MVYLVPFDGSALSEAALVRAREFAEHTGREVIALTVIPPDEEYASERGWADADGSFDPEEVAARLEAEVADIAPNATFRWEETETVSTLASTTMDVSRTIRKVAHEVESDVVFIGSENAGRVTAPVTSVGEPVSEDPAYDVFIVRHPD